ncbi:hypothetical protein GCM10009579_83440 [Streptomyces javensis]|uniref:Uncharacterized protein n=1 Tax=Streptomyces javensis TaxID=114698 RepID=A0ABP4I0S0_9ACTN
MSGACAVAPPVDVEEGHEEADRPVTVEDEAGPGYAGIDVRLGQRLHDRRDQVLLIRTDPQPDRDIEVVRGDLLQTECARDAGTIGRSIE